MPNSPLQLCEDKEFEELVENIQNGKADDLVETDRMLQRFPGDPRLQFLRGSLLAGMGRSIEALSALRKAVELAPDFAIARFQLGFFLLTSGDPGEALSVWGPLAMLPKDHYLRIFVGGLTHLIRDEFDDTIEQLERGIAVNSENLPLNRDMQLIIDKVRPLKEATALAVAAAEDDGSEAVSGTSFLLDQLSAKRRRH